MSTPSPVKQWPHRERVLGRVLAAQAAALGEKPFVLFEGRSYSYAAFDRQANRLANGLDALGVARGTQVALLIDNKPELLLLYFALGRLGAVAVPLNTAAKGEMLAYFLAQSDSTVLVADAGHLPRAVEVINRAPALRQVVTVGEAAAGEAERLRAAGRALLSFDRLLEAAASPVEREIKASDLCLLMYSSGTTGRSKASMASHCCALSHGYSIAAAFGYTSDDVLYVTLPLFHGNAWYCSTLPALVAGATVALARRFSVSQFWEDVNRTGATQFNLLGAMTNFLWNRPPDPLERSHRVRQAMVIPRPGDEPAFEARFGVKVTSLYGLTDAGIISTTDPEDPDDGKGAGRPCPDVEVRIVDEEDQEVPAGTVGEIVLRGKAPWLFPTGYYNMPEATVAAWRNLWLHTGDRGCFDARGRLHFTDRKKDAIRRRGENISCFEVEQIIARMPEVALVAAYPVRADYAEDEVMVSIVPKEGASLAPEAVIAFCQANMAYFMVPRFVELAAELPMTMNGKVEKYRLRERAEAALDRLWDREKAGIKVTR